MRMHCRRCEQTFDNAMECPDCGDRLQYYAERRSGEHDLSAFAGSDAFKWKKSVPQAAGSRRGMGGRRLAVLAVRVVAALVGMVAAYFARASI